jgi:hypothetical protein
MSITAHRRSRYQSILIRRRLICRENLVVYVRNRVSVSAEPERQVALRLENKTRTANVLVERCRAEKTYILPNHHLRYFICASNPFYHTLLAARGRYRVHLSESDMSIIDQLRSRSKRLGGSLQQICVIRLISSIHSIR